VTKRWFRTDEGWGGGWHDFGKSQSIAASVLDLSLRTPDRCDADTVLERDRAEHDSVPASVTPAASPARPSAAPLSNAAMSAAGARVRLAVGGIGLPGVSNRAVVQLLRARSAADSRDSLPSDFERDGGGGHGADLVVRRQGRGDRGAEEGRAEGRETRTSRAFEDDDRRGRPPGGDGRARRADLFGHFESDWAGRAILERYLSGEGDWDIRDDDRWTAYLKRSLLLRGQLRPVALDVARKLASANKDGQFTVHETFHAGLENGEGIIGYQYLHGTNKNVGDFDISGSADVAHLYGQSYEGQNTSEQPGTTITMRLQFVWNDMIDPNSNYTTDIIKSAIAEIITLGEAESYRISIGWHGESQVWLPETGGQIMIGYPGP
jgi:hypothetical protein